MTITVTPHERKCGKLSPAHVEQAVEAIHTVGFVVLEDVVSHAHLDVMQERMDEDSQKLIEPDSDERTSFYNHAFVMTYEGKIADACAKPHLATESVEQYLADSIDVTRSLYPSRRFRPGQPGDIRPRIGVRAVL